ncbi:MAG: ExeM/NucH family extracellular endonuclease [Pseudomonadota bacterium]
MKRLTPLACLLLAACGGGGGGDAPTAPPVTPPVTPPSNSTPIADIQGSGTSSPLAGQMVRITGVVTGDFQDNDADTANNLGGFYVQSASPDNDPATSDGVFVFDGSNPAVDVSVGDVVEIDGTVDEFFGETQVAPTSVTVTVTASIQPTDINLPVSSVVTNSDGDEIADLEQYEGMLVRFPQPLSVSSLRFLEWFGEVSLAEGGRPEQFTNSNPPSAPDYAAHRQNLVRRSIVLDDGMRVANASDIRFLDAGAAADYSIRAGDTIAGLTGVLRYSRGSGGNGAETWRLMPTEAVAFTDTNPRPGAPQPGGSFRVASFNVLNLFSGIDTGVSNCGPAGNDGCRGADSSQEQTRQLDKIVSAIVLLDADVIGLIELENNAAGSIELLVDAVNARLGSNDYDYIDTGTIHNDAIKVALMYRSTTATPVGAYALLDSTVDARFNDSRNRPVLAQTFDSMANGGRLTVAVNHLKSKGSSCDSDGDPNLSDGQGNCNMTRTNAAEALADWLLADPTSSGDNDFIVIGDLNAYTREDPIAALQTAGLVSLLSAQTSPYSFLFDEQIGALDHAIVSASLEPQVVDVLEWHINADEPPLLDYNLENGRDAGLFDATSPYRASDHDPVVVGLDLN